MTSAGRVAVVTGGSRGIGRASAVALARRGVAVVAGYVRDDEAADDVVQTITSAGGQALAVRADLANELHVNDLFDQAERAFGGIDIVVHAWLGSP